MIRAVTFDAAGTLIAPREPVGRTYARIARECGIPADEAAVEQAFRAAFRAAPPLAFPDVAVDAREDRERAWWRDVVRAALGPGGAHAELEACFGRLFAYYADGAAWIVYPEVPGVLDIVRARGLRTGVVSNFDRRLPRLLDELGLAPRFDAIVWSSDVGAAKPAAAIFTHAVRRLGIAPAETCHVGDDLEADVGGAARAGLRAIHLDRRRRDAEALSTLTDLERLLARADSGQGRSHRP
jgi:putative hydrolase of the HAD superfamily